ncbi:MAG: hypothetical protein ACRER5_22685 [Pseudomonas sp.]
MPTFIVTLANGFTRTVQAANKAKAYDHTLNAFRSALIVRGMPEAKAKRLNVLSQSITPVAA